MGAVTCRQANTAAYRRPRVIERELYEPYVQKRLDAGDWRLETIPAGIVGLRRDIEVFRATRKTNLIVHKWHGDSRTFCPPTWWDLAIGSGPCGMGCRGCFLMLTFRSMRDPLRHVLYDNTDEMDGSVAVWLRQPQRRGRHVMGVGIDRSDSLLYEGVTGHVRTLAPLFADPQSNPKGSKLLLLTKTANVDYLDGLPTENVMVSFSLNPQPIADLWEGEYPDTGQPVCPSVESRLVAAAEAQKMGFEIRLRVDPIMTPPGWESAYEELCARVAQMGVKPTVVTFGMYRQKNGQLDTWREKWRLPPVEWDAPVSAEREGSHCRISKELRRTTYDTCHQLIRRYLPDSQVGLCKETRSVRKVLGLQRTKCNCMA